MALMIPEADKVIFPNDTEREFYNLLKDSPKTKDWTVLYSYRKDRTRRRNYKRVFGDIDFIALIPDVGVLVLEIKKSAPAKTEAHEFVYSYDGVERIFPNPFRKTYYQSKQIKDMLRHADRDCAGLFVGYLLVFPNYRKEFPMEVCIKREHYLNGSVFNDGKLVPEFPDYMKNLLETQKSRTNYHSTPKINETLAKARLILEPVFDSSERETAEEINYSGDMLDDDIYLQYSMISQLPRALILGAAGTGKTYMAYKHVEKAREQGLDTLFICHSRLMGNELSVSFRHCSDVDAMCAEDFLLKTAGMTRQDIPEGPAEKKEFYEKILPRECLKNIRKPKYDLMIIDEFQEMIRPEYGPVLDALVKGGLRGGKVWLLSDFENNAFDKERAAGLEKFIKDYGFDSCRVMLSTDYRNPAAVTALASCAAKNGLSMYERNAIRANGAQEIIVYDDIEDEKDKLEALLDKLLSKSCGYSRRDLVALSAHSGDNSVASALASVKRGWGRVLQPKEKAGDNDIAYTSVRNFKGLESDVVIITDIDDQPYSPDINTVVYSGITRAKYRVSFMVKKSVLGRFKALIDADE